MVHEIGFIAHINIGGQLSIISKKEINAGHTYIKNFLRNTRYTRGTKQVK